MWREERIISPFPTVPAVNLVSSARETSSLGASMTIEETSEGGALSSAGDCDLRKDQIKTRLNSASLCPTKGGLGAGEVMG